MARAVPHPVLPGGLSPQDHDRICELAERGWGSWRIARAISKHPSTVQWFMYRNGLKAPTQTDTPQTIRRGDKVLVRFTREEDTLISELRRQGCTFKGIAEQARKRFGHLRPPHSIMCRLWQLAALDEAA